MVSFLYHPLDNNSRIFLWTIWLIVTSILRKEAEQVTCMNFYHWKCGWKEKKRSFFICVCLQRKPQIFPIKKWNCATIEMKEGNYVRLSRTKMWRIGLMLSRCMCRLPTCIKKKFLILYFLPPSHFIYDYENWHLLFKIMSAPLVILCLNSLCN